MFLHLVTFDVNLYLGLPIKLMYYSLASDFVHI